MAEGDLNDLGSLNTLMDLRELVEFLKASGVTQFDMERPEMKIRLKFAGHEGAAPAISGIDLASIARMMGSGAAAPAMPLAYPAGEPEPVGTAPQPAAEPAVAPDENAGLHIVRSPLVGTFYDAPSPGAPMFVKVGDRVEMGKVLCIVEAMKIMNEIECDTAGEVVRVLVKPGQPVEYGQQLFAIRA